MATGDRNMQGVKGFCQVKVCTKQVCNAGGVMYNIVRESFKIVYNCLRHYKLFYLIYLEEGISHFIRHHRISQWLHTTSLWSIALIYRVRCRVCSRTDNSSGQTSGDYVRYSRAVGRRRKEDCTRVDPMLATAPGWSPSSTSLYSALKGIYVCCCS